MLASYTLISIQVFNRGRAGELERATIEDFNSYKNIDKHTDLDIFKTLSTKSQSAVKRYVRFLIRGKKNRIVPVLLHKELVECIELIIKYRGQVGISKNNPYIFGLPGDGPEFKYLRAVKLLRDFSEECDASNPSALRGTQLRKQIATQSVLLNLEETEVEDLVNFMGHSEKIHRKHYRIPIATREIANISRLLEMAQGEEEDTAREVSDEDMSNQEQPSQEEESTSKFINFDTQIEAAPTKSKNTGNKRNQSVIGSVKRNTWITPEKKMARTVFKNNIDMGILPTYAECAEVVKNNPELGSRTAMQLKLWIHNQTKKQNETPTKKGKRVVRSWTTPERHAAKKAFSKHIQSQKLPTLMECSEAIEKFSPLRKRSATIIKGYVNNLINRQKKNADNY